MSGIAGVTNVTAEVERTLDVHNRLDVLKSKWATLVSNDTDYGFDATTGLLQSVSFGLRTTTFSYASGTQQIGGLTYAHTGQTMLTTTKTIDQQGRVGYISHVAGGSILQKFNYSYSFDRVTQVTREHGLPDDEQSWYYKYDPKGQVESADKRFSTNGVSGAGHNFLAGYQTQYSYDEIGNRVSYDEGGSSSATEGTGVRTHNYVANALNQYTSVTNPTNGGNQEFHVTGRRFAGQTVTVNALPADYETNATPSLHFCKNLATAAGSGGVGKYQSVTVTGTVPDSGNFYLPPPTETPVYDADGNLRQDGRWDYVWDAESRLVQQTTRHTPTTVYKGYRISHGYDGLSGCDLLVMSLV